MSKVSSQTKWNSAHPKELWAHSALRSALRKGLIVRGKCEVCGAEGTDGHHADYDRPMQVNWLCRLHHRHVHMKDRKTG
jgi:hypothetical protein